MKFITFSIICWRPYCEVFGKINKNLKNEEAFTTKVWSNVRLDGNPKKWFGSLIWEGIGESASHCDKISRCIWHNDNCKKWRYKGIWINGDIKQRMEWNCKCFRILHKTDMDCNCSERCRIKNSTKKVFSYSHPYISKWAFSYIVIIIYV